MNAFQFADVPSSWKTEGPQAKIQQTKMLGMCQRIGDWFLFGLVWQYSSIQKNIIKVGAKSWLLT